MFLSYSMEQFSIKRLAEIKFAKIFDFVWPVFDQKKRNFS